MGRFLKRVLVAGVAAVMIGGAMGCPKPSEPAPPAQAMSKCSGCGMEMKSSDLCVQCKSCKKCDKCPPASGTATYKCGCGNTKTVAASSPAPSC